MTGAALRTVREALGLTRPQLGELLRYRGGRLTPTTIYRWETSRDGKSGAVGAPIEVPPSVELTLRAIARRCRVRWPLPGRAPRCEACGRQPPLLTQQQPPALGSRQRAHTLTSEIDGHLEPVWHEVGL